MDENRKLEPKEWLIRVGDQEYLAPDLETLKQWAAEGRVPRTALVFSPSMTEWKTVAQVTAPPAPVLTAAQAESKRKNLIVIVALPLLMIGGCFACTMFVGSVGMVQEAGVKRDLPEKFSKAEAALQENRADEARKLYAGITEDLDSTTLSKEKAKAKAGYAAAAALMGDQEGAVVAFKEALDRDENIEPPVSASAVLTALYTARSGIAREAAERKSKAQASELKSRLEGPARRYIEHEAGDADIEITGVGDPYLNGGYWMIQVHYVKDDFRGRRAKITAVAFSPINWEIAGSRDVM